MQGLKNSQSEALKLFQKIDIGDREKLMQALQSGDNREVRRLMKKIEKQLASKGIGNNLKTMATTGLRIFQEQSEASLSLQLEDSYRGTFVEKIFQKFPKLKTFTVRVLRDKDALPTFFNIIADRTRLIIFAVVNLVVIFINFFWKRKIRNNHQLETGVKFKKQLMRMFLVKTFQFGFLAIYWNNELYPLWVVFRKTFLA